MLTGDVKRKNKLPVSAVEVKKMKRSIRFGWTFLETVARMRWFL